VSEEEVGKKSLFAQIS